MEEMTTQEVKETVEGIMKNHRVYAQRKANKFLSKHLHIQRESQYEDNRQVDANMSPVKGNHKSDIDKVKDDSEGNTVFSDHNTGKTK